MAAELPADVLLNILGFVTGRDIAVCRRVCRWWKDVIDGQIRDCDWLRCCKQEFTNIYETAQIRTWPRLSWFEIYRSLYLWPKLMSAKVKKKCFAVAEKFEENIQDFQILNNGVIGVHKTAAIIYYDVNTLTHLPSMTIFGDYLRYAEDSEAIIILTHHSHLIINRKEEVKGRIMKKTIDHVKTFILHKRDIYYVTYGDAIRVCSLADADLKSSLVTTSREPVAVMVVKEDIVNIVTTEHNLYTIIEGVMSFNCQLRADNDLLEKLHRYNLLENFERTVPSNWRRKACISFLNDAVTLLSYGDMLFIGTRYGNLEIIYAPHSLGYIDKDNIKLLQKYSLRKNVMSESYHMVFPYLIYKIDVVETQNGHKVFVALHDKIVVLEYDY